MADTDLQKELKDKIKTLMQMKFQVHAELARVQKLLLTTYYLPNLDETVIKDKVEEIAASTLLTKPGLLQEGLK